MDNDSSMLISLVLALFSVFGFVMFMGGLFMVSSGKKKRGDNDTYF